MLVNLGLRMPKDSFVSKHYFKSSPMRHFETLVVCICFVTKPTNLLYLRKITCICPLILKLHKPTNGVSMCSIVKIVYIQIIWTDLWSFCTLTPEVITTVNAWNSCSKNGQGKVNFNFIQTFSFSTAKISELVPDIILSSGDVFT